jgi:hypothetical protein
VNDAAAFEHASEVKARHEADLMARPGVVGVGVGLRQTGGAFSQEIAIVVLVRAKRPADDLAPGEMLPRALEGVPLDVQEVGEIRPLDAGQPQEE